MKKFITVFITAVFALSITLVMASCANAPKDTSSSPESSVSSQTEPATSETGSFVSSMDETTPVGTKFATMKEYAESPDVQKQMQAIADLFKDSGLEFSMTGEDNRLIFTYTYLEGVETSSFEEAIEEIIEKITPTFEQIAGSLKNVVEVDNPVLVVRYLDADGTEVYSKEFSSEPTSQQEP